MKGIDWETIRPRMGVDPDTVIAADLKVSRERVRQICTRMGIAAISDRTACLRARTRAKWFSVDWEFKRDSDVALELGYSKSTVRLSRIRYGIPPRSARLRNFIRMANGYLKAKEIAAITGCHVGAVAAIRIQMGLPAAFGPGGKPLGPNNDIGMGG